MITFPTKIQSKFVKYNSTSRCYETPDSEGKEQNFYSLEGLIQFLGEQGYWFSGFSDYNVALFQRFEPKEIHMLPII